MLASRRCLPTPALSGRLLAEQREKSPTSLRSTDLTRQAYSQITATTTPFRSATDTAGGPFLQPANIDYRYAALASAFDLLGRVHQLHREPFDVSDPKSVEAFCSSTAVSFFC